MTGLHGSCEASTGVAGLAAILPMMVGLSALVLRAERRLLPFDTAAALMLVGYLLGVLPVRTVSDS